MEIKLIPKKSLPADNITFARKSREKKTYTGNCIICGGEDKKLASKKHMICHRCMHYVKDYLNEKYGGYYKNKLVEAIKFLKQPIPCKSEGCDNTIPPFVDGKRNNNNRCAHCYAIWKDGFDAGRLYRSNYRRNASVKRVYGGNL